MGIAPESEAVHLRVSLCGRKPCAVGGEAGIMPAHASGDEKLCNAAAANPMQVRNYTVVFIQRSVFHQEDPRGEEVPDDGAGPSSGWLTQFWRVHSGNPEGSGGSVKGGPECVAIENFQDQRWCGPGVNHRSASSCVGRMELKTD